MCGTFMDILVVVIKSTTISITMTTMIVTMILRCVHISDIGVGYISTMLALSSLFLRWL